MKLATLLLSSLLLLGCAATPQRPLPQPSQAVDVERFLGRWYIIANIPYVFERGKVGSYVEYRARDDGRIGDHYFAREGSLEAPLEESTGVAEVVDTKTNAHWRAQFIWPLWASFHILYVDEAYRHALIGHPSREYAWIYAREPRVDPAVLEVLFRRLEAAGYRRSQLVLVPQLDSVD